MATLTDVSQVIAFIDDTQVAAVTDTLRDLKDRGGRLFTMGNGGGAAHASHAASDFRKIAGIEAYCVNDNVAELTARINDCGWETSYLEWLYGSNVNGSDALFVLSVGGGNKAVSRNLDQAMRHTAAEVVGIVGAEGGTAAEVGTVVRIPSRSTPIIEGLQAVLWHLIVEALR